MGQRRAPSGQRRRRRLDLSFTAPAHVDLCVPPYHRLLDTRAGSDNVGRRTTPLAATEIATFTVRGTNDDCAIPNSATRIATNATAAVAAHDDGPGLTAHTRRWGKAVLDRLELRYSSHATVAVRRRRSDRQSELVRFERDVNAANALPDTARTLPATCAVARSTARDPRTNPTPARCSLLMIIYPTTPYDRNAGNSPMLACRVTGPRTRTEPGTEEGRELFVVHGNLRRVSSRESWVGAGWNPSIARRSPTSDTRPTSVAAARSLTPMTGCQALSGCGIGTS